MAKTIQLYTHTDLDGYACAILMLKYYEREMAEEEVFLDIEFCNYDDIDSNIEDHLFGIKEGKEPDEVFITDISVSNKTAEDINEWLSNHKNTTLRLLDHHDTATRLNAYDWVDVDPGVDGFKKCGAYLLYKHLYGELPINDAIAYFVNYVRLWDTFEFENDPVYGENAKKLNYLFTSTLDKDKFMLNMLENYLEYTNFIFTGEDLEIINEALAKEESAYNNAKNNLMVVDFKGKTGGFYFGSAFVSMVCNRLCKENPNLDFVCCLNLQYKKYEFRCVKDDLHLGEQIATLFGGGGHPRAAGAQISDDKMSKILGILLDV